MNKSRDEIRLKKFGEHFRKVRKSKRLTQKALAFEADIEISQITRIENGRTNARLTTLIILADALGITLSKLLDFKY